MLRNKKIWRILLKDKPALARKALEVGAQCNEDILGAPPGGHYTDEVLAKFNFSNKELQIIGEVSMDKQKKLFDEIAAQVDPQVPYEEMIRRATQELVDSGDITKEQQAAFNQALPGIAMANAVVGACTREKLGEWMSGKENETPISTPQVPTAKQTAPVLDI